MLLRKINGVKSFSVELHYIYTRTQALGFAILVSAAVAVDTINDNERLEFIEDWDDPPDRIEEVQDDIDGSRGAAGWLLFLVIVTFIVEGIWTVIRFLNFGLVNLRIAIFLAIVSYTDSMLC